MPPSPPQRELGAELAEAEVLAAALDEAEGGGVPEHGGAPVAEHDLIAVGEGEQLGEAIADPAHDARTGCWRWLVPR